MLFFNIIFKLYFEHFIFFFYFNALTERVKCFHRNKDQYRVKMMTVAHNIL